MFRNATLRLTARYIAILAIICLFFSLNLYLVSTRELNFGLRRQTMFLQNGPRVPDIFSNGFINNRQAQLEEAKKRIIFGLVYLNVVILILGGIGSYFLAKRTLQPIQEVHDAQVRFTSDASHELRTPLAAMHSEIEVALRDQKLTVNQTKTLLKSNLEELAKLTALADGLLKLARNGEPVEYQTVSLVSVIDQAINRVSKLAQSKKITVNNQAQAVTVAGDKSSLAQLIIILLDNAIKYSDEAKTVTITAAQENHRILLSVQDEGEGIKSEDLPHIFNRFYRTDSSRSKVKVEGHGLGLSIARKIVESHHGSIEAHSSLGLGSTFIVRLPAA